MPIQVTINNITGQTPYDVYICQGDATGCFYISTITQSQLPYVFDIPVPYDTGTSYLLRLVDANNCIITGIENV